MKKYPVYLIFLAILLTSLKIGNTQSFSDTLRSNLGQKDYLIMQAVGQVFMNQTQLFYWNLSGDPCQWSNVKCNQDQTKIVEIAINGLNTSVLPPSLGYLDQLYNLTLKGPDVKGVLPSNYSNLENLQTLDISHSSITGTLPVQWANMASLEYLWLNDITPGLTGPLPNEWGLGMSRIRQIHLNNNQLSGQLPYNWSTIGNFSLQELKGQNMTSFNTLNQVQFNYLLDLSNNQFTGGIPQSWPQLAAPGVYIDLSNNKLNTTNITNDPKNPYVLAFCDSKQTTIEFYNNAVMSNINAILSLSGPQVLSVFRSRSNSNGAGLVACQGFQWEKNRLLIILFGSFAGALIIFSVLLQLAMFILFRGESSEEAEQSAIMRIYYSFWVQRIVKFANVGFLYVSLYSNIRYLLKFKGDPVALIVLAFIIFLTYLIQMCIQMAHFGRRRRTINSYPPSTIDWSQYNFTERFLLRYMYYYPLNMLIPIYIIINQVLIESLLVMDYMLGFSDFFRRGKGNFMEKAYFIDNVYDSREAIKVFVESILNISAQSIIFYLGGSVNRSFSLENISSNDGLSLNYFDSFVLAITLSFVTIIKKVLVIQLLARFNKLRACSYLNEQFNDFGGKDVYVNDGQEGNFNNKRNKAKRGENSEGKENIRASYGGQNPKQQNYQVYPRESPQLSIKDTHSNHSDFYNTNSRSTNGYNPNNSPYINKQNNNNNINSNSTYHNSLYSSGQNGHNDLYSTERKGGGVQTRMFSDEMSKYNDMKKEENRHNYMNRGLESPDMYGSERHLMDHSSMTDGDRQSSIPILEQDDEEKPRLMSMKHDMANYKY